MTGQLEILLEERLRALEDVQKRCADAASTDLMACQDCYSICEHECNDCLCGSRSWAMLAVVIIQIRLRLDYIYSVKRRVAV